VAPFCAQVELQLAAKAKKSGDLESAKAHLEFAKSHLASASEFNAPILFHFQANNPPGLAVQIEGLSAAEKEKLKAWSRKLQEKLGVLEGEVRRVEGELGK
jgi:hypothetical protein